jgi:hypothetical protein
MLALRANHDAQEVRHPRPTAQSGVDPVSDDPTSPNFAHQFKLVRPAATARLDPVSRRRESSSTRPEGRRRGRAKRSISGVIPATATSRSRAKGHLDTFTARSSTRGSLRSVPFVIRSKRSRPRCASASRPRCAGFAVNWRSAARSIGRFGSPTQRFRRPAGERAPGQGRPRDPDREPPAHRDQLIRETEAAKLAAEIAAQDAAALRRMRGDRVAWAARRSGAVRLRSARDWCSGEH